MCVTSSTGQLSASGTGSLAGGTWGSVDPTIATIDASTGIITTVTAGTTTFYYDVPTGCAGTFSYGPGHNYEATMQLQIDPGVTPVITAEIPPSQGEYDVLQASPYGNSATYPYYNYTWSIGTITHITYYFGNSFNYVRFPLSPAPYSPITLTYSCSYTDACGTRTSAMTSVTY